jgi:glycosyltransferase involved in cell wall biosynthesis
MINKKVIHLITTIERGGAEKQLLVLAKEQVNQGFAVEVIYLKGKAELKDAFQDIGVKINEQVSNKKITSQIIFLRNYFLNNQFLIHAHLPRSEVVAYLTTTKNGYVFTRHNYEQFWPSVPKFVSSILSRIIITKAVGGIVISKALKEFLINNKEIPKNFPVQVIHYGFDQKITQYNSREARSQNRTTSDNNIFSIGIISRLVPGKDYPTLFEAIKELLRNQSQLTLSIVGDGYQKKNLLNLSKKLGIEKKLIWRGKIENVEDFLSELDLFVFTSKGEGFGLVLLEAMLALKPIVASNNSAIPEVLGSNYDGLYETGNHIELAAKILKVIQSKEYSKELINSYLPQIKLFDPVLMEKSVREVYERFGF